jgi:hypothetical protein
MKQLTQAHIELVSGGFDNIDVSLDDGFQIHIHGHAIDVKSADFSGVGTDHLSITLHTR